MKAWVGSIAGNDAQWRLPSLAGAEPQFRPNPVPLVEIKSKALATILREQDPPLKGLFLAFLVVLVSEDEPLLEGRCADATVLLSGLIERLLEDPRPYKKKTPADAVQRAVGVVTRTGLPIAPSTLVGSWNLIERAATEGAWEVWSATPRLGGAGARAFRLKRYWLDPLLTGTARDAQHVRARRDLDALQRLNGTDGAVPLVSAIEETDDAFIVVTDWPRGESLASLTASGPLKEDAAEEVFEALVTALASVHRAGVVHRNLSPDCAHYLEDGRVVLTDFDYARLPSSTGDFTRLATSELAGTYVAPEVLGDPGSTSKASDVWSAAMIGLSLFGDANPDADGCPPHIRAVLKRALDDDPSGRPADAEILLADLRGDASDLWGTLQPNDELEGRWVVQSRPVEGGIARVYKVYDTVAELHYAAKFVKAEFAAELDPALEYRLLADIPDHPGIVKPEIPQTISTLRRGGRQIGRRDVFVPTRWVDGTRLDFLLGEKLPLERCLQLARSIAAAVEHLHSHNLLHRDLKPQNVLVALETGEPLVVDFNVSKPIDVADRTRTGTEPYKPPDLNQTGWARGADVFAIAVILCELLAGDLLRPSCREWLAGAPLPGPLAMVLERATAGKKENRFDTVPDFVAALDNATRELPLGVPATDAAPPAAEDLERPDWNPYQSRLIGLFSQSSTSNAGTRGLDEFGRWAYVNTLIDQALADEVVKGSHALVVITGNAGDGKTAFIQMLERRLTDDGGRVRRRSGGNGAEIEWGGRRFVTNWDGSQDEEDFENEAVLADFFDPFQGDRPSPGPDVTRVIAINEGRLLDFLAHNRDRFTWLASTMLEYFTEQVPPAAEWLTVVNLNLRALTAESSDRKGPSIVAQLLARFADQRLWEPCAGCRAYEHCYARSNADTLRDPVLGPQVSERIRQTLDVARLRRRLHITMRDLRSALAFTVAGNRTCDEIVDLVEGGEGKVLLSGHLYNSLFGASDRFADLPGGQAARADRLLAIVGTLDVARTADPGDDARLWALGVQALRPDPESLQRSDRDLIGEIRDRLPGGPAQLSDRQARTDLRLAQGSLRRKLFLEREDPDWVRMLPYERLTEFYRHLDSCGDEERREIIAAISGSEGLFGSGDRDVLGVRLASDAEGPSKSFVTHDGRAFVLEPVDRSSAAEYVEYAPDTLVLRHIDNRGLSLEIDLDLFETLARIRDGFTPSREELRGAWLNLRIFKEQLATFGADTLLLTRDDRGVYRIAKGPEGAVEVREVA